MNEIITTGIVLSSMPIGEYDRRVEILSAELGRISAFARGARKPGSSLVSVTRVFAFGQFRLYQGKTSYSISSAVISNYFEPLSADIDLACYGFYFLEVSQYFTRENVECQEMLKLLYFSLRALSIDSIGNRLVKSIFELKTLVLNGLCPAYDRLFRAEGIYAFAAQTCQGARRAFDHVQRSPVEKLYTFILTDPVLDDFEALVKKLMEMNTDRQFKSLTLIS